MNNTQNKHGEMSVADIINSIKNIIDNQHKNNKQNSISTKDEILDLTDIIEDTEIYLGQVLPESADKIDSFFGMKSTKQEEFQDDLAQFDEKFFTGSRTTQDTNSKNLKDSLHKKTNDEALVSERSARDASDTLKQFAKQAKRAVEETNARKTHSVESLVVNMMRPQLKKWLDDNLPSIVREVVEKEIRRLVPDDEKES